MPSERRPARTAPAALGPESPGVPVLDPPLGRVPAAEPDLEPPPAVARLGRAYPSLDREGLRRLRARLRRFAHEADSVTLDAADVADFGAGFLGVLARVGRTALVLGKPAVLVGPSPELVETLRLARLDRFWRIA